MEDETSEKIVRLAREVKSLSSVYEPITLLTAHESALSDEAIIMLGEDESFDLNVVTQNLLVRYNSPASLEQAERDLIKFRGSSLPTMQTEFCTL